MQRKTHLADLVEKERAFVCLLEQSRPILVCPCEGPFDVAEELALEELRWNGSAVYRDESVRRPRAEAMQCTRYPFFSSARLSEEQDRRVARCDPGHQFAELAHGRRAGQHVGEHFVVPIDRFRAWQ